jgi:hypothetical protein
MRIRLMISVLSAIVIGIGGFASPATARTTLENCSPYMSQTELMALCSLQAGCTLCKAECLEADYGAWWTQCTYACGGASCL